MMRVFLVFVVIGSCLALGFGQAGQAPSQGSSSTPQPQPAPPAAPATQANPAEPIAELGDYKLTESEFNVILSMLPGARQNLTPERKLQIARSWMQIVAFARQAKDLKLDNDPLIPIQMELHRLQLLAERYQRQVLADVKVTDEEVRQYFETNKEKFALPAMVRVSRILAPTPEKAQEVERALKQGTPFEEVAKAHSTDAATKDKGGDMGWLRPGTAEPIVEKTALATAVGQVSSPFQSSLGWQLIRVNDKRPGQQKTFAEVQKVIEQQLLTQKRQQEMEKASKELFEKYGLKMSGGQK